MVDHMRIRILGSELMGGTIGTMFALRSPLL
jgi:hypothetical protein